MKKEEEIETNNKIFLGILDYLLSSTKSFIELYETEYKSFKALYELHMENEPLKFFKRAHKQWDKKRIELNQKKLKALKILIEEWQELDKIIETFHK